MFFGLINALAGTCRCRRFSSDASPDLAANELRWGQSKRFYAAVASKVKLFFFFLFLFQQFHNLASPIEGDFPNTIFTIKLWETHVLYLRLSVNFWCTSPERDRERERACLPTGTECGESESESTNTHTHTGVWQCARQESNWSKRLSRSSPKLAQLASAALSKAWERESARHDRPRSERVISREEM